MSGFCFRYSAVRLEAFGNVCSVPLCIYTVHTIKHFGTLTQQWKYLSFSIGHTFTNLGFSIAMLDFQRVYHTSFFTNKKSGIFTSSRSICAVSFNNEAMKVLLHYKANPNKPDHGGYHSLFPGWYQKKISTVV